MQTEISLDKVSPKIAVMGVGGAGGNAVDNMIRSNLGGVSFFVCNTDAQALSQSLCCEKGRIRMGFGITQGLGAGSCPDFGQAASKESIEDILKKLDGVHMLFITAGMGGGTGTGASPIIATAAREKGILTVGVVTKPFHFEGSHRMNAAEKGICALRECVDTLLVIPNQNLFRIANPETTFAQAFSMADDILFSGVKTFTDLMFNPGLVNCDFADICTVMRNTKGRAMMGSGTSSGDSRATEAAEKAIGGLLLDHSSLGGAKSLLINVTGGSDLRLYDVDEAIGRVRKELTQDKSGCDTAHIIFGATFDEAMEGSIRVSVVATGIQEDVHLEKEVGHILQQPKDNVCNTISASTRVANEEQLSDNGSFAFIQENVSMHEMGSRHQDPFPFSEEEQKDIHSVLKEETEEAFGQNEFSFDSPFSDNNLNKKDNTLQKKKDHWIQRVVKLIKGNEVPTIMPTPSYGSGKRGEVSESSFEDELPSFLRERRSRGE